MRRVFVCCILVSGWLAVPQAAIAQVSTATSAPTTSIDDRIAALIAKLGHDDYREREAAERELIDIGPGVVDAVRDAVRTSSDAEIRSRGAVVVERIADDAAVGPTRVTLNLKNALASDAFADLSRQAKVSIRPYPPTLWESDDLEHVTLDAARMTFWDAVLELRAQTGLVLRPSFGGEMRVSPGARKVAQRNGSGFNNTVTSGPFLFTASRIARSRTIDLEQGTDVGEFAIVLVVQPEPKLRVLRTEPARIEIADDDAGNSLAPPIAPVQGGARVPSLTVQRSNASWQTSLNLRYPPSDRVGKVIRTLRATMGVTLQTRSETVEVDDLMNVENVEVSVGQMHFTVNSFDRSPSADLYELKLTVPKSHTLTIDEIRQNITNSFIQVTTGDSRSLSSRGVDFTTNDAGLAATIRFYHERLGRRAQQVEREPASTSPALRLVWEMPTDSRRIDVPFEIHDLPIP